ncbi:hypothetical protein [Shimia sp. MIT1388]|uniref:hypothetical protein n=1 Tax=Shimia sp. MIT1388 TaxID=3096992 RepID=UPI0039999C96
MPDDAVPDKGVHADFDVIVEIGRGVVELARCFKLNLKVLTARVKTVGEAQPVFGQLA